MKRYLIFSCILALALILGGCTESDTKDENNNKEAQNNSSEQESKDESSKNKGNKDKEKDKDKGKVKIDSATVYQQGGISILTKSFEKEGVYGPSIQVEIENKSDKNVTIQTTEVSVNDFMVDTIFSADVAVGKKVVDEIVLVRSGIDMAKIKNIGKIDLKFNIIDSKTYETIRTSDLIQIKTNKADKINPSAVTQGTIVFDEKGIKIHALELGKDSIGDSVITFYIENNQDIPIIVQAQNFSADGYMVEPIFSAELGPNKKIVDQLSVFQSDLKNAGIDEIKTVEFELNILDGTTWETKYTTDTIKLSFK